MNKLQYISKGNLSPNLPIQFTALVYLFMDKFNAPGWLWGVVITILVILWLAIFYVLANAKHIDIIKNLSKIKDIEED